MSVVSNTTVISNFAAIGRLDVLEQLFGTLFIPTDVYSEIEAGLEEGYTFYQGIDQLVRPINPSGWLRLTSVSNDREIAALVALPAELHAGERACLVIGAERGWLVLTDDAAARRQARLMRIHLSGSIGCLVNACRGDILSVDDANACLNAMMAAGYRSPVSDLNALLGVDPRD